MSLDMSDMKVTQHRFNRQITLFLCRPSTSGEGRNISSCIRYEDNLAGDWPYRPQEYYKVGFILLWSLPYLPPPLPSHPTFFFFWGGGVLSCFVFFLRRTYVIVVVPQLKLPSSLKSESLLAQLFSGINSETCTYAVSPAVQEATRYTNVIHLT